jgi:predicted CopG family antitoxin
MEITRTIRIKDITYKKLRKLGLMGETFDDLINRLMFDENVKAKKTKAKFEEKV